VHPVCVRYKGSTLKYVVKKKVCPEIVISYLCFVTSDYEILCNRDEERDDVCRAPYFENRVLEYVQL